MKFLKNPFSTRPNLLILSAAIVIVLIVSGIGVYALVGNSGNTAKKTPARAIAAHAAVPAVKHTNPASITPVALPQTSAPVSTAVTPTTTVSTKTVAPIIVSTPAPVAAPVQLTPSISFSLDGCYVTATGSPGMILSGTIHNVPDTHGGPMGSNPSGVALPSTGTLTEEIADTPFSYTNDEVDAVLTDQSGNTVSMGTAFVVAPTCP